MSGGVPPCALTPSGVSSGPDQQVHNETTAACPPYPMPLGTTRSEPPPSDPTTISNHNCEDAPMMPQASTPPHPTHRVSPDRPTRVTVNGDALRAEFMQNKDTLTLTVVRRDGLDCRYCDNPCRCVTLDHLTPLERGGTNDPTNLGVACYDCNNEKSTLTAAEYTEFRRVMATPPPSPCATTQELLDYSLPDVYAKMIFVYLGFIAMTERRRPHVWEVLARSDMSPRKFNRSVQYLAEHGHIRRLHPTRFAYDVVPFGGESE